MKEDLTNFAIYFNSAQLQIKLSVDKISLATLNDFSEEDVAKRRKMSCPKDLGLVELPTVADWQHLVLISSVLGCGQVSKDVVAHAMSTTAKQTSKE